MNSRSRRRPEARLGWRSVGILICGSRNDHTVRYSKGSATSPMAVSTYSYDTLPADERSALPAADQLAAALDWVPDEPLRSIAEAPWSTADQSLS
ncbi:hypothetical protein E3T19_05390 [Cryobacterium sp. TMT4-31]|nr:hypothetical protein E3T19_05390 [Cryobacterium sp. TMT4-31]